MSTAISEFVSILVGSVVDLGTGVAEGIANMASALFLKVNSETGAVTGLSIFGSLIGLFAGLGLAVGVTTKTFIWITKLGKN